MQIPERKWNWDIESKYDVTRHAVTCNDQKCNLLKVKVTKFKRCVKFTQFSSKQSYFPWQNITETYLERSPNIHCIILHFKIWMYFYTMQWWDCWQDLFYGFSYNLQAVQRVTKRVISSTFYWKEIGLYLNEFCTFSLSWSLNFFFVYQRNCIFII